MRGARGEEGRLYGYHDEERERAVRPGGLEGRCPGETARQVSVTKKERGEVAGLAPRERGRVSHADESAAMGEGRRAKGERVDAAEGLAC